MTEAEANTDKYDDEDDDDDAMCPSNDTECFFSRYSNLTLHRVNPIKVFCAQKPLHRSTLYVNTCIPEARFEQHTCDVHKN